jgi:hypothetical protein
MDAVLLVLRTSMQWRAHKLLHQTLEPLPVPRPEPTSILAAIGSSFDMSISQILGESDDEDDEE